MIEKCYVEKKQRVILYFFFVINLFFLNDLQAQITIGSDQYPNSGALLDLKQNPDGTSYKGLGLPRVLLKSLKIIGDEKNLATTIDQASGIWNSEEHIGLVVYNISEYDKCDPYSFRPGPYVWSGEQWQLLMEIERSSDVKEFVDPRDGEIYLYRSFGDAGEWMLEHMRYIPKAVDYPDLTPFPDIQPGIEAQEPTDKLYYYPNSDLSTPGIPNPDTWRPNQGILYTYSAATMGAQDDVSDNQGGTIHEPDADGPSSPIQGICPPGWHIPSDKEWNRLEKEIYNNANKYSRYKFGDGLPFDPEEWNVNTADGSNWELSIGPRGVWYGEDNEPRPGHGFAMLSQCPPIKGILKETEGESLSTLQGGFDVILSGAVSGGQYDGYGSATGFWSSSVYEEGLAWARLFTAGIDQPQQVGRIPYERATLSSVRCKR